MTDLRSQLRGLWLPLITPFRNGELDEVSLRRLVRHYGSLADRRLILAATTGEGLTLSADETAQAGRRMCATKSTGIREALPVCLGLSGSDTRRTAGYAGTNGRDGRSTAT
jgi:4-hydroxy-tetrahydrodipicolinate synthase